MKRQRFTVEQIVSVLKQAEMRPPAGAIFTRSLPIILDVLTQGSVPRDWIRHAAIVFCPATPDIPHQRSRL
mgnify:CR=1 FL=1